MCAEYLGVCLSVSSYIKKCLIFLALPVSVQSITQPSNLSVCVFPFNWAMSNKTLRVRIIPCTTERMPAVVEMVSSKHMP